MNMDRFRFRAWHNNQMGEAFDLTNLDEPICYWPKGTILMQCTGLRDSEGELIWEGDIVQIKLLDFQHQKPNLAGDDVVTPEITNICEVRFRPSAGFVAIVRNAPYKGNRLRLRAGQDKVVGNIYENPELLK